jgi:hypothetical protein
VAYSYSEWKRREMTLGQFLPDISDQSAAVKRTFKIAHIKQAVEEGHARIATNPSIGAALRASGRV